MGGRVERVVADRERMFGITSFRQEPHETSQVPSREGQNRGHARPGTVTSERVKR